jgi:membrane protease YdiL (CAAX protease family)
MTADGPTFSSIILFGIFSLIMLLIGKRRDFFSLPTAAKTWRFPIQWTHVVGVFAIYFGVASILTPIFGKILQHFLLAHPTPTALLRYASWINFINSGTVLLFLLVFFFYLPKSIHSPIWVRKESEKHLYKQDFLFAALAWAISFPLIIFVNQLIDWILSHIFQFQLMPEQLAVHFLKMTFGEPFYLLLAILTIVVFAPFIEEILFRGFLQSFIRQHLGSKQAVVITSTLFSFFHYSPEQGMTNLTIIASLFVFSLFLGFVYEKKGSLPTSIALHALFNLINVGNLYFLGGIPGGCL